MALFTDEIIEQVWRKATKVPNYDPSKWRKDFAGAWIRHDYYGTRHEYGWEIDHLVPRSSGGTDALANLTPLHWRNNMAKGNSTPLFKTAVTSEGNQNIEKERKWRYPRQ